MNWTGSLEVRFADGSQGAMDLNFTTQVTFNNEVGVDEGAQDLAPGSRALLHPVSEGPPLDELHGDVELAIVDVDPQTML